MSTTKQMHINHRVGAGVSVIHAACLVIFLAPVFGWAQSESKAAPTSETRTPEVSKAVTIGSPSAIREVSFSHVFDRLALTSSQQSRWNTFRDRVEGYTSLYYRQTPIFPSADDAATHQIGRMVGNLENRLAALEEVEAAAKSLYESLTPEQQKIANESLILTIPTFSPSSNEPSRSDAGIRHGGSKPEGGKRSHRSGGSMAGPMVEN